MIEFLKKFTKRWFRNFLTLIALAFFYPGFRMASGLEIPLIAAFFLNIIQLFLQPLLKLLFLPINIITLGMFRWILEAVHLLIVSYFIRTVAFIPFTYQSFTILGINIPKGDVNIILSVVLGSIAFKLLRQVTKLLT